MVIIRKIKERDELEAKKNRVVAEFEQVDESVKDEVNNLKFLIG